jgi:hypothetical protein
LEIKRGTNNHEKYREVLKAAKEGEKKFSKRGISGGGQ